MDTKAKKLTNEVGAPVAENEHSLTAGPRGPVMMQDVWLMEKLAHFDREVIPERRMHAKGWGAYGTFECTEDISAFTKAKVLQKGTKTDLFVRFSTVAGNGARLTQSAISAAWRSSFIQKKETGIWSEIIHQPSSSVMSIISRI